MKNKPTTDISKDHPDCINDAEQDASYNRFIAMLKQECGSDPKIKVLIEKGFAAFLKVL